MAFSVSDYPVDPSPIAADAELATEIMRLRRLCPDLAQAEDPIWLSDQYRALAHRLVASRSTVEPV